MISGQISSANQDFSEALDSGNQQEARRLLENGAVTSVTPRDFALVASSGDMQIINALLTFPEIRENVAHDNNAALRFAVMCGHLPAVNRLLEFPIVVAAITTGNNAALRWALHQEQHEIVARLLQIPTVAAYEAEHPESDENDLSSISQDNESSIRNLSSTEIDELLTLKKRYANLFQKQGLDGILNGLRNHLIAQYHENPAQYQCQSLPLEYNNQLGKEAIEKYYKNSYHTAYRYLFCQPNPWIAPDALWIKRDAQGRTSANISDGSKENIAYLWLAASHDPLPLGFTRDDIQNRFIDLLVDAGRGHNWDNKRKKTIFKDKEPVEIQEVFDDGEGDKPSCSLGVTRRTVAQFLLLLQPEVKALNVDTIYLQFKEKLVTENSQKNGLFDKIMELSPSKLEDLKSALRSFVFNAMKMEGLSETERDLLQALSVDMSTLKSFMKTCQQDFGERFTTKTQPKWQGEIFDSYEKLIQHFTQNTLTVFYNELYNKCEDLTLKKPFEPVVQKSLITSAPLIFSPKRARRKRPSEVAMLLQSSLGSGLRRSPRLADKGRLSSRHKI